VAIRFDAYCRCLLGFCASALHYFSAKVGGFDALLRHGMEVHFIYARRALR